jgi:hypothetical protein|tara:strand:+ start:42 stop:269 length:228 start_codon:yes stop_codon:yes gene_type:complete
LKGYLKKKVCKKNKPVQKFCSTSEKRKLLIRRKKPPRGDNTLVKMFLSFCSFKNFLPLSPAQKVFDKLNKLTSVQ